MTRAIRTLIDVFAYGAICFALGILTCSWWVLGPRKKEKQNGR